MPDLLEHRLQHYVTPVDRVLASVFFIEGKWHPAVRKGDGVCPPMFYWPNLMFNTSEDALARSLLILGDTLSDPESEARMRLWNIWPT